MCKWVWRCLTVDEVLGHFGQRKTNAHESVEPVPAYVTGFDREDEALRAK
jgi:hypothetical protein